MSRHLARLAATLATGFLMGMTSFAQAAIPFDISYQAPGTTGNESVVGQVVYWSSQQTFRTNFSLIDYCAANGAGDGYEAAFFFELKLGNGTANNTQTWITPGCGQAVTVENTVTRALKIRAATPVLLVRKPDSSHSAGFKRGACMDNPHIVGNHC